MVRARRALIDDGVQNSQSTGVLNIRADLSCCRAQQALTFSSHPIFLNSCRGKQFSMGLRVSLTLVRAPFLETTSEPIAQNS